ncbi:MATE family efflux transporter [Endozoicomonas euniceicola]|uniref:MATE family efflux transporter n=1 Tax=Endozoicomonas euniceicola TaxID=1234143 RepID=A0ABY6GP35_9GAMM|nr:MATE family efflux transporter [Endozoicomonas euniceicola]UYM14297.1 MATE family efflux transporter [Endozoicomonas euniceicola]
MSLTHRDYFKIAIPFIISTVTQPLLGAVDTAVIGRLGVTELIGGVAIGTVIMNTLYWLFGFFRVSTTGQSAIALGKNCNESKASSLIRPFVLAGSAGLIFILLQSFIWQGALTIIEPEAGVALSAKTYFDILIWGAPFVLLNYTLIGWLMGQAKVKETLYTQIFGNVLNIILDAVFVLYLDFGVAGVAFASLTSQVITFIIGMYLIAQSTSFSLLSYLGLARMSRKDLKVIISSNTDLLLRTVCILTFFNVMARMGSQLGADILATNAILMQVTFIVSYMFDGVANASSVFSGKAVGAKDPELLKRVVSLNVQWTTLFVAIATAFIILFQNQLVLLFTQIPSLIAIYHEMSPWLTVFPLVAGFGLTFYGIFTGTGTTVPVRNSSIATLAIFLFVVWATVENWGNHGLWLAFTIFYIGRFAFLVPFLRQVFAKAV